MRSVPSAWAKGALSVATGLIVLLPSSAPAMHPASHGPSNHERDEGVTLVADFTTESVGHGPRCPVSAAVRAYEVVAVNVEISLNRFLDHDPAGRMYVLQQDLDRVRREEALNRNARSGTVEPA